MTKKYKPSMEEVYSIIKESGPIKYPNIVKKIIQRHSDLSNDRHFEFWAKHVWPSTIAGCLSVLVQKKLIKDVGSKPKSNIRKNSIFYNVWEVE